MELLPLWFCGRCLLWYWALLPPLLLPLLLVVLLMLLLQAALRHAACDFPKDTCSHHHQHHKNHQHTSTTSTTSKEQHLHESASLGVSFCGGGLPSFLPLPVPPFLPLPLLAGAINSASLYFLRAAQTLNFNLIRVSRSQGPPAPGFSPESPEPTS